MSVTRLQAIANVREVADAAGSGRWSDTWIKTVLGLVGVREWIGILGANPTYRFGQRSVTASSLGVIAYSALDSGSADTAQKFNKILSVTDGQSVYHQSSFQDQPLATSSLYALTSQPLWYDAGDNLQILPVAATALTVSVNHMPPRIDNLSADSVVIEFPEGHETILWLEAAAMILSKGGMENDAAQTMRAMADQERQTMYARIQRRAAAPMQMGYPDSSADWAG